LTASKAIAAIFCAGVVVIAIDGFPDTSSRFTVVTDGTGITVEAFSFIERFVGAAILAGTGIDGAVVSIIAGRLIDAAIAIIVDAVTDLFGRFRGGAGTEA